MQAQPVTNTVAASILVTAFAIVLYCGYVVAERMHASLFHISHFSYEDKPWVVLNGTTVVVGAATLIAMLLISLAAKRTVHPRPLKQMALCVQVASSVVIALLITLVLSPGTAIK